jgi:proteasome lid subunit RPN8/RPN11
MIRLPETAIEAIRQHGRESYRDEACGAMYGRVMSNKGNRVNAKDVVRVAPLENARENERHRRFVVTPDAYRKAEAEASRTGLTLLGFYHSHPDHPAYPSAYDLEHAFPFFSYVILAVENAEPKTMRSFVLANDRKEFIEEKVEKE